MLSIEYIAGFVDGEGCISAYNNTGLYVCFCFRIANTNCDVLNQIAAAIETRIGVTSRVAIHQAASKQEQRGWKPLYMLSITGKNNVANVCRMLLPHLVVKRSHAEVMLELTASYSSGLDFESTEILNTLHKLNRRGTETKLVNRL